MAVFTSAMRVKEKGMSQEDLMAQLNSVTSMVFGIADKLDLDAGVSGSDFLSRCQAVQVSGTMPACTQLSFATAIAAFKA